MHEAFEVILPLTGFVEGLSKPVGSSIAIGHRFALTARHVLSEAASTFQLRAKQSHEEMEFFMTAISTTTGLIWDVRRIIPCKCSDIALLELNPTQDSRAFQFHRLTMVLEPPCVGDEVRAIGFVDQVRHPTEWGKIGVRPKVIQGTVSAVFEQGRDSYLMPWPCFEIQGFAPSGMSGGPILNAAGRLIGITSSSFESNEGPEQGPFYGSLLWPLMRTGVNLKLAENEEPELRTFWHLAQLGVFHVLDLDNPKYTRDWERWNELRPYLHEKGTPFDR